MWKNLFSEATLLDLPLIAMFGFLLVFATIVVRVLSKQRTAHFEDMSRLPFDES